MKVELLDLETGETIMRMPIDAREIIAAGCGRYCYPKDAPTATQSQPAHQDVATLPIRPKRDNKAAVAAMQAANAKRRAANKQAAAASHASQE